MKTKKIQCIVYIVLTVSFFACKENPPQQTSTISQSDTVKNTAWNKLFGIRANSSILGAARMIPSREFVSTYAEACIKAYKDLYENPQNLTDIKTAYTESIGFSNDGTDGLGYGEPLSRWLNKVVSMPEFTDLLIFPGIYVDPSKDPTGNKYGLTPVESNYIQTKIRKNGNKIVGSLTVFLCPYHITYEKDANGKTKIDTHGNKIILSSAQLAGTDPFNLGDLYP